MMKREHHNIETSVHCGKRTDGLEKLTALCRIEAEKLLTSLAIPNSGVVAVPFWTSDLFAELICVGYFKRDALGMVVYDLDFSESTL